MNAKNDLVIPISPPKDWGVTKRKHNIKDFTAVFKFLALLVFGANMTFVPLLANIRINNAAESTITVSGLGIATMIIAGIAILFFALPCALDKPKEEAADECKNRGWVWRHEVLKPYLEAKYDLKFHKDGFYLLDYPYTLKAFQNGSTINLELRGLEIGYSYEYGDLSSYYPTFSIEDDIWLEQIIKPKESQYIAMNPVVNTVHG